MWRNPRFLPLLSGLLLTLSFPPFNLLLPPFFAVVFLLLFLERTESTREVIAGALILGLVHYVSLLYWIVIFSWIGFFLLMGYLTFYPILWCLVHHYMWKRSRSLSLFIMPFSWVCFEYYRGIGELGFTWGQLAYSLTGFPILLQFADTTGPYGVSFWIAAVNVLIYLAYRATGSARRLLYLSMVVVSFACAVAYGLAKYSTFEADGHINIAMVQPGLDQDVKWNPAFQDSTIMILSDLSREVTDEETDLVIWPETAVPTYLKHDLLTMTLISDLARELHSSIILGAPHYEVQEGEYRSFNIALYYDAEGMMSREVYKKIHLVPFGEKTPWEDRVEFLRNVDLGGGHFTSGTDFTIFRIDSVEIGTLICFESIFPELSRSWRKKGADLLVNITNDAWFKRTSAPYQHASAIVLRAIENRVSIARAANTGVTLTVDPLGRIGKFTRIFVRTTLSDRLPVSLREKTIYTELGDFITIPCWIVFLCGLFAVRIMETVDST
ncbi:MAG: apolipoprotein N-acyltransferase [Candidatus Glassbacteria bacterium]